MRNVLIATVFLLLSACAAAPRYVEPSGAAKNLAHVYIYRTNVVFHSLNPERPFFYIDDKEVAKLGTGAYVVTRVTPGKHTVSVKESIMFLPGTESGKLEMDFVANEKYYIRYSKELSGVTMVGNAAYTTGDSHLSLANRESFEQLQ